MNYTETLSFLYEQLPVFSRIGHPAYKKGLGNIIALCDALDNPQKKIKTIHIAGTNGKGSTSHILASIFQKAGYKTGLLTSPHVIDFRERIRSNGEKIKETFIVNFIQKLLPLIKEKKPSFFELTTAMAFEYFYQEKVNYAIIETGLGGEFDSTNIIVPKICLITNIAYDHQDILGNTLQEISTAKAGIIKPNIPVFIGDIPHETKSIFLEKAAQKQAPLVFSKEAYEITLQHSSLKQNTWLIEDKTQHTKTLLYTDLLGYYQANNIILAMSASMWFVKKGVLAKKHLHEGIKTVKKTIPFLGRWDILSESPLIIADVAHNEHGIQQVISQIYKIQPGNLHILYGMTKEKSIENIFSLLPQNAHYYFTQIQDNIRSKDSEEIQQIGKKYNLQCYSFLTISEALEAVKKKLQTKDTLLITGSIFLVGEVYQQIGKIFTQIKNIFYE
ncbi:MAG: bifunctional folylpolyglutamate synthase/dihydrofolate synthase [Chitinophagaceae bacterium]